MCENLQCEDGIHWEKAIPLPYYTGIFGLVQCTTCMGWFLNRARYERHYRMAHDCECGKYPFKKE